ncbi:MAG: DUF4230 domain-containing protein [Bryobacterales bacterium]|nr:DUF4230 domain-containing protein [Bryobacterales bacterium]
MSQRTAMGLVLSTLLVFVVGVAVVALRDFNGRKGESGAAKLIDPPAVITQIQGLRELVTVKYGIQKVVALEEKKVPFGAERMLLFVQAEVSGGIDLSQLREEHVKVLPDGALAIALPSATITSVVIDDTQTRVWDRSITWWTPWVPYNPDLERQARLMAKSDCEKAALDMGMLVQARRNAEEAIRALLLQAGARDVRFLDAT